MTEKERQEIADEFQRCKHIETKCDSCGKDYYEPKPVTDFGEFNLCDDCKKRTDISFE